MIAAGTNNPIKSTSYKVVIPFYAYAALSFLLATILILTNPSSFIGHYFNPQILAITHIMALGWGTMMIIGASHQLFPVLIEGRLFSNLLAYLSFIFSASGIPILVYAFYNFDMGAPAEIGAILVNLSVICYISNLLISISRSKNENVHAMFAITAVFWLFLTTILGLLLVYNFTHTVLSKNSVSYLSLHAHIGIIGWFLLMIIGVGSRLIPMFLISKYENKKLLWLIYALINVGLISFGILFLSELIFLYPLPFVLVGMGVTLFGFYIFKSYKLRIRKKVDEQVKTSILSIALMVIPLIILIGLTIIFTSASSIKLVLLYGFTIFFGWITAIILGMTFKTLPFIIWNKVYHNIAGISKTPNPKDLFSSPIYIITSITYILGLVVFGIGIIYEYLMTLNLGAALLFITALLYNYNVFKILFHKVKTNEFKNK